MDTQKPLRLETVPLKAGDSDTDPQGLFRLAYAEFPELRMQPFSIWYLKWERGMHQVDRYLVKVRCGELIVGMAAVVLDDDPHVGLCLTLHSQYVLPAYRNKFVAGRVLREVRRLAKVHRLGVIAYSHRVRDWTYELRYIAIAEGN
jgi:GNAT superfamily N-acetyltransferase